jgi:TonB family protein
MHWICKLRISSTIVVLLVLTATLLLHAQQQRAIEDSAPFAEATHDTLADFLSVIRRNGLSAKKHIPYHLKMSYQVFDPNNTATATEYGTVEMFLVSDTKYRGIFTTSAASANIFGTSLGVMRSGDLKARSALARFLSQEYLGPLPAEKDVSRLDVDQGRKLVNGIALRCFAFREKFNIAVGEATACVDPHTSSLQLVKPISGIEEDRFENQMLFDGTYIPRDIEIRVHGNLIASAHLDVVEELAPVVDAVFTPPPDAKPLTARDTPAEDVVKGILIKKVEPEYPKKLKKAKIQGTVVLKIKIGKDGLPKDFEGVSGPPELQQEVIKAVRQWVYQPFMLYGEPIEVDSTITSVFKLGN